MMVKVRIWLLGVCMVLALAGPAQEVTNNNVEQALEDLAEAEEMETEDDSYLQQLSQLRKNPLNINTATLADLQIFRFLNELLLIQLMNYRKVFGPLQSVYELQAVPGWDIDVIQRILPYIRVGAAQSVSENFFARFRGGDHSVVMRAGRVLERQDGFVMDTATGKAPFPGNPYRYFFRYKYVYKNNLQFGIVGDKDPGEQFFKGAQRYGFDHYSFHLFARNLGIVKRIAIGDYTVNMGQGLLTYQSLAFRKSVDVMNIKRQTEIFRPYNSAGEFNFHRGAAITLGVKNWSLSAFVNTRKISANVNEGAENSGFEDYVSSFLTMGMHRTASEIENRQSLQEFGTGGALQYRTTRLQLGFNGVHYRLGKPLIRQPEPYNQYRFSGDRLTALSGEYAYTLRNFHFFGEMAFNPGGGKAMVHGMIAGVDRNVDFSLLYRKIDPDYHSLYGNAFTENTLPANENGLYMGVSVRPWRYIKIDAYADVYRFPWLLFRTDKPASGKDYFLQMTWKPNKQVEVYTRYRTETKAFNTTLPGYNMPQVFDVPRQNWRTQVSYKVSQAVTLRARAEASWFDAGGQNPETGLLFYTDFFYKPLMKPLSLNLHWQYFETDGFNSRIYAYENDMLYSFSIPFFSGKGTRVYTNINYDISRKMTVWFRIARTLRNDGTVFSTAGTGTGKPHQTDFRIQVRYTF